MTPRRAAPSVGLSAALLAALALALLAPSTGSAQDVPTREVRVRWADETASISFDATDLADRGLRRRLRSGYVQTLAMRVYAYGSGGEPVAVALRSCRVLYDMWEENYRVQVQTDDADRVVTVDSVDEVLRTCMVAEGMRVGRSSHWRGARGGRVYFAALVELNPVSPDMVHRIRRWLARPGGATVGGGDAFFGSFVSLFVNRRIAEAELTFRFRSQEVPVP